MSRRSTPALVLAALLALVAADAEAISISMDPTDTFLGVGDTVDVDLNVTLGAGESLGVFDIDVAYDPAILQLNLASFGSELSVVFPSIQIATTSVGSVNLFELSLDSVADLEASQPGSFTIATLTFEMIQFGSSAITPTVNVIGDAEGIALDLRDLTGASVSAVPEPTSAVLWMAGLLVVHRRIRRGRR